MEEQIKRALEAREKAYCKSYKVGALLKMKSGKEYTGCNINNQGIQSICAERVAFAKAISEGEMDFEYIIVVGGDSKMINLINVCLVVIADNLCQNLFQKILKFMHIMMEK